MGLFSRKPINSFEKHHRNIVALQGRQREIMAKVDLLKEEARVVQGELDAAQAAMLAVRKDIQREVGIEIAPVGIASGEKLGIPGAS